MSLVSVARDIKQQNLLHNTSNVIRNYCVMSVLLYRSQVEPLKFIVIAISVHHTHLEDHQLVSIKVSDILR